MNNIIFRENNYAIFSKYIEYFKEFGLTEL